VTKLAKSFVVLGSLANLFSACGSESELVAVTSLPDELAAVSASRVEEAMLPDERTVSCGGGSLNNTFVGPYMFEGIIESISEAVSTPQLSSIGYVIGFEDVNSIVDFGPATIDESSRVITNSFSQAGLDGYVASGTVDVRELAIGERLLVTASEAPRDSDLVGVVYSVARVGKGSAEILGTCSDLLTDRANVMAVKLGLENSSELLRMWADSLTELGPRAAERGLPQDLVELEQTIAIEIDEGQRQLPPDWSDQDPLDRSLRPGDVPEEIAADLDVRAAFLDLKGVAPGEFVAIRTESGVSGGLVGSPGQPLPVYFLSTDRLVEIVVGPVGDSASGRVLDTVSISSLTEQGVAGFRVTGPVDSPVVELLDEKTVASLLGVEVASLETLRATLLTRPTSYETLPGG
jgi:hypothetical protein